MRGNARGVLAAIAACSAALALSGCVVINGTGTGQPASMGPVNLSISACVTGSPSCLGDANTGSVYDLIADDSVSVQLLVAMHLPNGSTPPDSLLASLSAGGTLPLTRSATYESELQTLEPAPAGERWWGWISPATTYSHVKSQSFTVGLTTTLPRPPDTGPLESPMHWRPVVGVRFAESAFQASRNVRCGNTNQDLYTGFAEGGGAGATVTCIDSPSPDATRGFLTAPVIDFGILGGAIQASPGSTVTGAFVAKRSGGPDPTTTFSLKATTAIPGGTVTIDKTSASLGGDTTQPVLATIAIPDDTPPGTYPVTLAASATGKPDRAGTIAVTVLPKPPAIRAASLSRKRFRTTKSSQDRTPVGTKLKVTLSQEATLSIAVSKLRRKRPIALGTLNRALPKGESKLSFRGRIGKVKLTPGRYRLTLIARANGQASEPKQPSFTVVGD